ncbi:MAG TPA: hypothetical protein VMV92_37075 [Streptosporangiaceae bacterium]|nr:hypothetical protein [Streptosporangiaceae bacterium]
MLTPSELNQQFSSPADRAAAQAELQRLGAFLREVVAAASGTAPVPGWLAAELQKPLRGHREPPGERLARYHTVFRDELQAIDDTLSSESQNRLDDDSLRAARYLARRLLATLLDCPPREVSQRLPATPS